MDICKSEAEFSYGDGLVIIVSGLIGSDELKKRFSQVFFLAPQKRGYHVLNDMFLYEGENDGVLVVLEKDLTSDVADELGRISTLCTFFHPVIGLVSLPLVLIFLICW